MLLHVLIILTSLTLAAVVVVIALQLVYRVTDDGGGSGRETSPTHVAREKEREQEKEKEEEPRQDLQNIHSILQELQWTVDNRLKPIVQIQSTRLKKGQQSDKLLQATLTVCQLLKFRNIPHCVGFGSLLGLVRNGRPIPGDDDVDLCVPETYHQEVLEIVRESGFTFTRNSRTFCQINIQEVAVDFYFFVETDVDCRFEWHFLTAEDDPDNHLWIPKDLFLPFKENMYWGQPVNTPAKPLQFIKFIYGPKWDVPMSRNRYILSIDSHHHARIEYV